MEKTEYTSTVIQYEKEFKFALHAYHHLDKFKYDYEKYAHSPISILHISGKIVEHFER